MGVTEDESVATYAYTLPDSPQGTSAFRAVNMALRFPRSTGAANMTPFAHTLEAAIAKLPKFKGPVVRRTDIPPDVMDEAGKGRFADAGFLSFSKDPNLFFGKDMIVARSMEARDLRQLSYYPDEWEVLYAPGTPFRVSSFVNEASGAILILDEA